MQNKILKGISKFYNINKLLIHIMTQILLFILYVFLFRDKSIKLIDIIVISFSFGICYSSFLLESHTNLNFKSEKLSIMRIAICFYILVDEYFHGSSKLISYFSVFLIFNYLETMMSVWTLDFMKLRDLKNIINLLIIVKLILFIIGNSYDLFLYGIIWILVSIYPVIFLLFNLKRIAKYGTKILPTIILLIVLQSMFITSNFFVNTPGRESHNYDIIFYIILLEIIFNATIIKTYKPSFKHAFYSKKEIVVLTTFILSILFFIITSQIQWNHSLIPLIFLIIFKHEFDIYKYYKNFKSRNYLNNSSINDLIRIEEFEKLYRNRISAYLHDEILQDILIIKKNLSDKNMIIENETTTILLNKVISSLRDEINLHEVKLDKRESLSNNYYGLIMDIQQKYQNGEILIDFECDDKFFVSKPFDIIIYRILHEFVTNIFKHSKGYYSKINLDCENENIKLTVENYGDYLNVEDVYSHSTGLSMVRNEVEKYGGDISVTEFNNDINDCADIEQESIVKLEIVIPIDRWRMYENFISRRS